MYFLRDYYQLRRDYLYLIDCCDTLFIFHCVSKYFRYGLISRIKSIFPLFQKFIDFGNFSSLTTSLDKFSSTAFTTGIIHERKRNRGNAIASTCIL
jgi:hypothetical protein